MYLHCKVNQADCWWLNFGALSFLLAEVIRNNDEIALGLGCSVPFCTVAVCSYVPFVPQSSVPSPQLSFQFLRLNCRELLAVSPTLHVLLY